tara:strand:+ start:16287 stop:16535 length:249 start_codon:yes stop_codon:yes gene_type:complete
VNFDCTRDTWVKGYSYKLDDYTYELCARYDLTVRHELAHIYNGHLQDGNLFDKEGLDAIIGYMHYFLIYEPSAGLTEVGIFN